MGASVGACLPRWVVSVRGMPGRLPTGKADVLAGSFYVQPVDFAGPASGEHGAVDSFGSGQAAN